jgi:hypothetical protein
MTQRPSAPAGPFAEQAFSAAAEAYMATPGSWGEAVHATLAGLLEFLATAPDRTRACVLAATEGGPRALEQRDRTLARFVEFLEPGYAASDEPPPQVVGEAIAGGIYELVRAHVLEARIELLPNALPDATLLALSPFLGASEAERLAARPISVRANR